MSHKKVQFSDLKLENENYEQYRVMYHGKVLKIEDDYRYQIEIFLYPLLEYKTNEEYLDNLMITRFIKAELTKWFFVGAIFNKKNEHLGDFFKENEIHDIRIKEKNFEFIRRPLFISTNNYVPMNLLNSMGIIEGETKTDSLTEMPCLKISVFEKNRHTPTKFILPAFEVLRYFYLQGLKLTNKILDGSYKEDVGETYALVEHYGRKVAFVLLEEGYSETERLVLAWSCLSVDVKNALNYVKNAVFSTTIKGNRFIKTELPIKTALNLKVKGFYFDQKKEIFFCEKIVHCDNIYPVDEVIYAPLTEDHRKNNSKNNNKTYQNYIEKTIVDEDNEAIVITSDGKSNYKRIQEEAYIDPETSSFFDKKDINTQALSKASKDVNYQGTTIINPAFNNEFTTNRIKSTEGNATVIIKTLIKTEQVFSKEYQKKYIESIIRCLSSHIKTEQIETSFKDTHLLYIIRESNNKSFYLLERFGFNSFERRLILIYRPTLDEISINIFWEILMQLRELPYTLSFINEKLKNFNLRARGFNKHEDKAMVTPEEISHRILDFITNTVKEFLAKKSDYR